MDAMTKGYFAVTVEYDHGVILASDVEAALETLGGPDHEVKATAVSVGERLHERLEAAAAGFWTLPGIVARPHPDNPVEVGTVHAAEVLANSGIEFELCDGRLLLRVEYPELYAAIGKQFGPADEEHFSIPDFRGRIVKRDE